MNQNTIKQWYRSANRITDGRLEVIKQAVESFGEVRGAQAAAGMAYYAILSIFPLLLVIIAGSSYLLDPQLVYEQVSGWMQENIPVSTLLIYQNIQEVLDSRGTFGVFGLLTLAWSASGVFTGLAYNINLAWEQAERRNFLEKRLVGLGMIAGISILLLVSLGLGGVSNVIGIFLRDQAASPVMVVWQFVSRAGAWFTTFLLFLAVYRWVPTASVPWKASIWSAVAVTLGWELALAGLSFSLSSGLQNFELVYGSLGTIVALLFLIYLLSIISLFGAHLCAAISKWQTENQTNSHKGDKNQWISSNKTT